MLLISPRISNSTGSESHGKGTVQVRAPGPRAFTFPVSDFSGLGSNTERSRLKSRRHLTNRHALLQFFEPIEDDVNLRAERRFIRHDHQEPLPIGGNVVIRVCPGAIGTELILAFKEDLGLAYSQV